MSNRDFEERQERDLAERVATSLDISVHQLDELDWSIDENTGNDGTVYGYVITFEKSDDPATQAFIDGLTDRMGWVQVSAQL
jgi:hypothetical protein